MDNNRAPNRKRILAIILGASEWPNCDDGLFLDCPNFEKSALDFQRYLISETGLGLSDENVKYLFNYDKSSADTLAGISFFLKERLQKLDRTPPIDLIIYYVGHGGLNITTHELYLTIKDTRDHLPQYSSLQSAALADVLRLDANKDTATTEVQNVCEELGLQQYSDQEFYDFVKKLNKEANEVFEYTNYTEGYFKERFSL